MNVRATPSHVDFRADREQAAQDEAQYMAEQRAKLINARADEINKRRSENLTDEDMALALETLSTYPMCISCIKLSMLGRDDYFSTYFETFVIAALLPDSIRQARQEFEKMDAEQGELH